ncbi:MAG: hypothetical protein EP338_08940 [Bacteroidetes bacterium]|nr:MAG: hypothetical protein EP338_08940 [Bacteroidota bacterium]
MKERRTGTSRYERQMESTWMNTFQVDDRSFSDICSYIHSYLSKILYYDSENKVDGNWGELVADSPVFFLVSILNQNPEDLLNTNVAPEDLMGCIQKWDEKIKSWPIRLNKLGEYTLAEEITGALSDEVFISQLQLIGSTLQKDSGQKKEGTDTQDLLLSVHAGNLYNQEVDLENLAHIYLKMILYLQELTRDYLKHRLQEVNDHRPDIALLMTFVELYQKVQQRQNKLPKEHLDFYYRQVLRQSEEGAQASKLVVSVALMPKQEYVLIPAGTTFSAGKLFGSKQDISFASQTSMIAVACKLTGIETLAAIRNPYIDMGTDVSLISSVNQNKAQLDKHGTIQPSGSNIPLFGVNQKIWTNLENDPAQSPVIGFEIASPVLFLSEGKRTVNLTFYMQGDASENPLWTLLDQISHNTGHSFAHLYNQLLQSAFRISYTSGGSWLEIKEYGSDYDRTENAFSIELELAPTDSAWEALSGQEYPALQVELNEESPYYAYSFFDGVQLKRVGIQVAVEQMRNLSVYNNAGKVVPNKTFDLFGPVPELGDYLMFGKSELFKKQLTGLELKLEWMGLPQKDGGFETYYQGYSSNYQNDSFQVRESVLNAGNWVVSKQTESLFSTKQQLGADGNEETVLCPETTLSLGANQLSGMKRDFRLVDPLKFQADSQSGFFKWSLAAPETGFGSKEYIQDYTKIAQFNAQNKANIPYPNRAFVPRVSGMELSYQAYDEFRFDQSFSGSGSTDFNEGNYTLLSPLGSLKQIHKGIIKGNSLFPEMGAEAYLLLSFEKVLFPTMLSLYFQLSSESPDSKQIGSGLKWEYRQLDQWLEMPTDLILSDTTNGFSQSGIVELALPESEIQSETGLLQIRISPLGRAMDYPSLAGIYMNAMELKCASTDQQIMGEHYPAASVKAIIGSFPTIQSVYQPGESYGGKMPEESIYARVRERLRHKERAISIWDYEHLVLQKFPEVRMVKCTNLNNQFEVQTDYVSVVVMSHKWNFKNQYCFDLNELSEIRNYLQSVSDPFCQVRVMNPRKEFLLVTCLVRFLKGDTNGYYLARLNEEINEFLSPVSGDKSPENGIGRTIVPQMLTSYLENLQYVDSVDDLYIEHISEEKGNRYSLSVSRGGQMIQAQTPCSIMIPMEMHNIYTDGSRGNYPNKVGIGSMRINQDFILQESTASTGMMLEQEAQSKETEANAMIVIKMN